METRGEEAGGAAAGGWGQVSDEEGGRSSSHTKPPNYLTPHPQTLGLQLFLTEWGQF